MPDPPPSTSLNESLAARVLNHLKTAYAVVDASDNLLWSNRAFQETADSLGLGPNTLAKRLCQPGSTSTVLPRRPILGPLRDSEHLLIELPSSDHDLTGGSLRDDLDPLTGVLTRDAFMSHLRAHFAKRASRAFALVFLDLNQFKEVNDRFGHLTGDACLREVASRLIATVRTGDLVGRFGGDEFLLLLPGVGTLALYEPIHARLKEAIRQPIAGPDNSYTVGASLGVAFATEEVATKEALITAADRAMYADKRSAADATS